MRRLKTWARCFECGWTDDRLITSARSYEHRLMIHWLEKHR